MELVKIETEQLRRILAIAERQGDGATAGAVADELLFREGLNRAQRRARVRKVSHGRR